MDNIDIVKKYFPDLDERQLSQFDALGDLYADWNAKINVISRKDIDNLYANHVLHSLAIAKFLGNLAKGSTFLDMGTGGGFPGIPLAIFYPDCAFHLIDRIGKKVRVAQEVAKSVGLGNVTFQHGDIGECRAKYNYVVSRAVMPLNDLLPLVKKNISADEAGNLYPNGVVCLKGGDLEPEKKGIKAQIIEMPLSELIPEQHFDDKYVVYCRF